MAQSEIEESLPANLIVISPKDGSQDASDEQDPVSLSSSLVESSITSSSENDSMSEGELQRMRDKKSQHKQATLDLDQKNAATMRHILEKVFMKGKEQENLAVISESKKEDPLKDLEEGIFIFCRRNRLCTLHVPVDEEDYLGTHKEHDMAEYQQLKQTQVMTKSLHQSSGKRRPTIVNQWDYASKIVVYDRQSLYIFHHQNKCRRRIVGIVESNLFNNTILTLIMLNSIVLAMYNYNDRTNQCAWNINLDRLGQLFSVCFILECILKIIAQGLIVHREAYLKDTWNWIDFTVVIVSILELIEIPALKLKSLRTLRVLRPLRSIKALPGMRKLISSLLGAIPSLSYAVLFMIQIFLLFGILGIQQFNGIFMQRCRITPEPIPVPGSNGTEMFWPYDKSVNRICTKDGMGAYTCPADMVCGTPSEKGLDMETDHPIQQVLINYGITSFDNIVDGFLTIFQMVTLEGWAFIMYNMMDATMDWLAIFVCVSVVILCGFFLVNVILAVLADSISSDELEDSVEIKKRSSITSSILRAQAQKQRKRQQQKEMLDEMAEGEEVLADGKTKNREDEDIFQLDGEEATKGNQIIDEGAPQQEILRRQITMSGQDMKYSQQFIDEKAKEATHEQIDASPISVYVKSSSSSGSDQRMQNENNKFELPKHAQKNWCFRNSYMIVSHPLFNMIIILLILLNIVVLSMDSIHLTKKQITATENFNNVVQMIFFFEMVIKIFGLGFREYLRDTHNWLDAFIVLSSGVEFVMQQSGNAQMANGALTALRGFRLLRVLKLARSWTAFRNLLRWLYQTFSASIMFVVLFILFMFIFMLVGMEFYSHEVYFNIDGEPVSAGQGFPPRANFDSPMNALTAIFIVAVGDDWNTIMYDFYRYLKQTTSSSSPGGPVGAICFFVLMYIMMNMLLLNLFLAILLDSYGNKPNDYEEMKEDEEEENAEDIGPVYICLHLCQIRLQITFSKCFPCCIKPPHLKEEENNKDIDDSSEAPMALLRTPRQSKTASRVMDGEPEETERKLQEESVSSRDQVNDLDRILKHDSPKANYLKDTDADNSIIQNKQSKTDVSKSLGIGMLEKLKQKSEIENNTKANSKSFGDIMSTSQFTSKKNLADKEKGSIPMPLLVLRLQRTAERHKKQIEQAKRYGLLKSAAERTIGDVKVIEIEETNHNKTFRLNKLKGKSLNYFNPESELRRKLQRLVKNPYFDYGVLVLIFFSTILLIQDKPLEDPNTDTKKIIDIMDQIMTGLFLTECLIKIIVHGFAWNGPDSYIKSSWNKLDFGIAIISSFSFLQLPSNYSTVKIFRLFRVLRPLRLVNRFPQMRIAVESIIQSVPQFGNLMVIFMLALLLFAILGTTFFKGKYDYCWMDNIPKEQGLPVKTMWDCFDIGGEWIHPTAHFDTTFNSMATLFTAVTTEGWTNVMWNGVDAVGWRLEPIHDNRPGYALFFVIFMMFCSIVILNLFVGVVIDTNAREKNKMLNNHMLTQLQIEYSDTLTKCYSQQPQAEYVSTNNNCKDCLHRIAVSKLFEDGITILILLNTVCMAMTWYGEPVIYSNIMWIIENIFAFIYTLEAIILISVEGKRYFQDGWKQFDFIIVVSALIGFMMEAVIKLKQATWTTVLRVFRIMRIFKMVKRFRQLHKIFNTFVVALPNLVQVGSLLVLFLIIYAVLGEFLFAKVMIPTDTMSGSGLAVHANFQDFQTSLITLLRMCTGEAWNDIMWDCSKDRSILYQCQREPQKYYEIKKDGPQQCGDHTNAIAYFVSFIIIGVFIMMNMFISLILDGYNVSTEQDKMRINDQTMKKFKECWTTYDPNATGLIPVDLIKQLVVDLILAELKELKFLSDANDGDAEDENVLFNMRLDPKMVVFAKWERGLDDDSEVMQKVKKSESLQRQVARAWKKFVSSLRIPTYNKLKHYQFHDTLSALVKQGFITKHAHDHAQRVQRIEEGRNAGIKLTKWEEMKEDSYAFKKLEIAEQEKFLDLNSPDFSTVVNRIEEKALRKGTEEIHKLKMMKEKRKKADEPFINNLDKFIDGKTVEVIDSSKIIGAQYLLQYVLRFKQKKADEKLKAQRTSLYEALKTLTPQDYTTFTDKVLTPKSDIKEYGIESQEKTQIVAKTQVITIDPIGKLNTHKTAENIELFQMKSVIHINLDYEEQQVDEKSFEGSMFKEENVILGKKNRQNKINQDSNSNAEIMSRNEQVSKLDNQNVAGQQLNLRQNPLKSIEDCQKITLQVTESHWTSKKSNHTLVQFNDGSSEEMFSKEEEKIKRSGHKIKNNDTDLDIFTCMSNEITIQPPPPFNDQKQSVKIPTENLQDDLIQIAMTEDGNGGKRTTSPDNGLFEEFITRHYNGRESEQQFKKQIRQTRNDSEDENGSRGQKKDLNSRQKANNLVATHMKTTGNKTQVFFNPKMSMKSSDFLEGQPPKNERSFAQLSEHEKILELCNNEKYKFMISKRTSKLINQKMKDGNILHNRKEQNKSFSPARDRNCRSNGQQFFQKNLLRSSSQQKPIFETEKKTKISNFYNPTASIVGEDAQRQTKSIMKMDEQPSLLELYTDQFLRKDPSSAATSFQNQKVFATKKINTQFDSVHRKKKEH